MQEVRKDEEHTESGGASQNPPQGRATAEEAASAVCEELRKTDQTSFLGKLLKKERGWRFPNTTVKPKGSRVQHLRSGFHCSGAVLLTDVSSTIAAPLLVSSLLVFTEEKP